MRAGTVCVVQASVQKAGIAKKRGDKMFGGAADV